MKTNLWKFAAILAVGFAAITACEPESIELPAFPDELYENYEVIAGETQSFTISPNMDWELTLPVESLQWFWFIKDGEDQKYDRISGSASTEPITIYVGVNDTNEFDVNRSVDISLTMGNQTAVVAKFMRPAMQRTINVFVAAVDEYGFIPSEDSSSDMYSYVAVNDNTIHLAWPDDKAGFMIPMKIDANCNWEIDYPEWVRYTVTSGTYGVAGVVEMRFDGVPSKYPENGATEDFIISATGDDVTLSKEYDLVIPACNDRIEFGLWGSVSTPLTFNSKGQYLSLMGGYADGPAGAFVAATDGARVFAVENEGEWYATNFAGWITIAKGEWNNESGAEVIQEIDVEISVSANDTGKERKAAIFFLPESITIDPFDEVSGGVFTSDGSDIKDEYKKYVIELTQEAAASGYITILPSQGGTLADVGGEFQLAAETWLPSQFGAAADVCYKLTYSKTWSRDCAYMSFASAYSSYEVYDTDCNPVASDELDTFWLRFQSMGTTNESGVIDMDEQTSETKGFIKFIGADNEVLAVVYCIFDPNFSPAGSGETGAVTFIGETASYASMVGASLQEVTSGEYYEMYKNMECPIWSLTYASSMAQIMPMSISIPEFARYTVVPEAYSEYVTVEGAMGGATISMRYPDEITEATAVVTFYDSSWSQIFILVCNWAPVQ